MLPQNPLLDFAGDPGISERMRGPSRLNKTGKNVPPSGREAFPFVLMGAGEKPAASTPALPIPTEEASRSLNGWTTVSGDPAAPTDPGLENGEPGFVLTRKGPDPEDRVDAGADAADPGTDIGVEEKFLETVSADFPESGQTNPGTDDDPESGPVGLGPAEGLASGGPGGGSGWVLAPADPAPSPTIGQLSGSREPSVKAPMVTGIPPVGETGIGTSAVMPAEPSGRPTVPQPTTGVPEPVTEELGSQRVGPRMPDSATLAVRPESGGALAGPLDSGNDRLPAGQGSADPAVDANIEGAEAKTHGPAVVGSDTRDNGQGPEVAQAPARGPLSGPVEQNPPHLSKLPEDPVPAKSGAAGKTPEVGAEPPPGAPNPSEGRNGRPMPPWSTGSLRQTAPPPAATITEQRAEAAGASADGNAGDRAAGSPSTRERFPAPVPETETRVDQGSDRTVRETADPLDPKLRFRTAVVEANPRLKPATAPDGKEIAAEPVAVKDQKKTEGQDPAAGVRSRQEPALPFATTDARGDGEEIVGPRLGRGPGGMVTADGSAVPRSISSQGNQPSTGAGASASDWRSAVDPADFMPKLVERAVMTVKGGRSEMQLVLKPAFLGQVRMSVSTQNQHVTIRIVAETLMVKDAIEDNINLLKAELQHQGLQVDDFEVTLSRDSHRDEPQAKYQRMFRPGSRPEGRTDRDDTGKNPGEKTPEGRNAGGSGRIDFFA